MNQTDSSSAAHGHDRDEKERDAMEEEVDPMGEDVAQGSIWLYLSRWGSRVLRFGYRIILARLLLPADFGIVAAAEAVVGFFNMISGMGLEKGTLYYQDREGVVGTAWSIQLVLRFAAYGVLFGAASVIAPEVISGDQYSPAQLQNVIVIIGLNLLFSILAFPGNIRCKIDLEFGKISAFQFIGTLVTCLLGVVLALNGFGYWSLVWGGVTGLFLQAGLFLILKYPEYEVHLNRDTMVLLLSFGGFTVASSLLGYVLNNVDDLIVGRIVGMEQLGYYSMAYTIGVSTLLDITAPARRVIFPALTRLKNTTERYRQAYFRSLDVMGMIAIPASVGLYLTAGGVTIVGLSAKWTPVIPVLKIWSIYALVRILVSWNGMHFQARGKPQISTYFGTGMVLITFPLLFVVVPVYGIAGAAGLYLLLRLVGHFPATYLVVRDCNATMLDYFLRFFRPTICAAIMAGAVMIVRIRVDESSAFGLMGLIGVGVVVYGILTCLFMRRRINLLKNWIFN